MKKVYIKGMVCDRCIGFVQQELSNLGIEVTEVSLGVVSLPSSDIDLSLLEQSMKRLGFSVIKDKKDALIAEIKSLVAQVYSGNFEFPAHFKFSDFVADKLHVNYDTLSHTFSSTEGLTLEKYIVNYRMEKVKEFLVYDKKTLADISFNLGFSSVAHLSRLFKNHTGLNPSYFRKMRPEMQAARHENNPGKII
jgi:AraC-like DNA-binding protein